MTGPDRSIERRPVVSKFGNARNAPDDDRAWLARANLAMRYGRQTEARSWLDLCLKKHPEDPVAWRADLHWVLAAEDPQEAVRALALVPADRIPLPDRLFLRAWLAARRNATREQSSNLPSPRLTYREAP
jgi:enediyne biosynthesis protein E4